MLKTFPRRSSSLRERLVKGHSAPSSQQAPSSESKNWLAWILASEAKRIIAAWEVQGKLTPASQEGAAKLPPVDRVIANPTFRTQLSKLQAQGVDLGAVLDKLCEVIPIYHHREEVLEVVPLMKLRREALEALRKKYQSLDTMIRKTPEFSPYFRAAWQWERFVLKTVLAAVRDQADLKDLLKPADPFTVHLDKDLSRQGFWTSTIVALVQEWGRANLKNSQAFRDIASLLHAAFPPFPDDPTLVKRRYYHAMKKQAR